MSHDNKTQQDVKNSGDVEKTLQLEGIPAAEPKPGQVTEAIESAVPSTVEPKSAAETLNTVILPPDSTEIPPEDFKVDPRNAGTVLIDGTQPEQPVIDRTQILRPVQNNVGTVAISPDSIAGSLSGGPADPSVANIVVQGYRILGELGRGGMGVVYRAKQIGLNRTVALKMIIAGAHASADQLLRFQSEAEAVAQLQHPNIVQVYDIGERDGLPFFSLEFVDGKPLDRDLDNKPQPEMRAAELAETLARAMQYAHDRGIIHRDLKPANVLLTKTGIPKITDFGLAKQLEGESSQTKTGTIMGTPSYMAPEQGRGDRAINHLADVYALGSMLYEFLTGRPPFLDSTPLKTLMRLLNEEPIPPSRIQPGLSRDIETICMKCLQKDPSRRYETAAALADDLKRFRNGEAILARRTSPYEKAWRWCRRNPKLAGMSAAIGLLIVGMVVAMSMIAIRRSHDRAAVAESRRLTEQRLELAAVAITKGDVRRAQDLLRGSDPLLASSPALADLRDELDKLRLQTNLYVEFHELLDRARFGALFSGNTTSKDGPETAARLLELLDQVENKKDQGRFGWPKLDAHHETLLNESIFEALLVASLIEGNVGDVPGEPEQRTAALRRSIELVDRAEKIIPSTKVVHTWRGGYLEKLNEIDAAKTEYESGAKIDPTSAVDRFWHAFADYLRAEEALKKGDGKAAAPSYRSAATGFTRVIEARPENFWAHFSWATCLARLGDRYGAIVGFSNSLRIRSDVPWPYNDRGTMHFQLGEADRARADFDQAVSIDPSDPVAYKKRGEFYYVTKDLTKAKNDFQTAVQLAPSDPESRRNHALICMLTDDVDGALVDWSELVRLRPDLFDAHYGVATIRLGQGEFEAALAELNQALALVPNNAQALAARATIYRWQDRFDDAQADLKQLLSGPEQNNPDYLVELADLYRALDKKPEAIDAYERCLAAPKPQLIPYIGLARVYETQSNLVLARQQFERMIHANAKTEAAFMAYLHRAEFFRNQKEFDTALEDCKKAQELAPNSILPQIVAAGVTAARGDASQAAADLDASLKTKSQWDGKICYAAACSYSLAAQAARNNSNDPQSLENSKIYAEKGAQFLAQTTGRCFHNLEYPEHNRVAWDPALATIRELPEVQKLILGRK